MELFPSDLGRNRYLALLRRRSWVGATAGKPNSRRAMSFAAAGAVTLASDDIKPSKHPFANYWTDGLRVRDPETRAKAASVVQGGSNGAVLALVSIFSATHFASLLCVLALIANMPWMLWFIAMAWLVGVYSLWRFAPRRWLHKMDQQPLEACEIESLLPAARGNLERQYVSLLLDIRNVSVPTESARREIRASVTALGEAVTALPGDPPTHGQTAVVYKNTLLQISHLRDVVSMFDDGTAAAIGAGLVKEATASIDRLSGESLALAQAKRELDDELGISPIPMAVPAGAPAPVETPQWQPSPVQQTLGQGNGAGNANDNTSNWWRQKPD